MTDEKTAVDLLSITSSALNNYRSDIASLEHPFFSLSTKRDMTVKQYVYGNLKMTVNPSHIGRATIFDKDIWLYVISCLQESIRNCEPISNKVSFTAGNFLKSTKRNLSGNSYQNLKNSLVRLRGTSVVTNIKNSPTTQETFEFGLIDSWHIHSEKDRRGIDTHKIIIKLPDWVMSAVQANNLLKVSSDYFEMTSPLKRRLYEIGRKHCGRQDSFCIGLEKLFIKVGSNGKLAKFRFNIKQIAQETIDAVDEAIKSNTPVSLPIPEYLIRYEGPSDNVFFINTEQNTPEAVASKEKRAGDKKLYELKKLLR